MIRPLRDLLSGSIIPATEIIKAYRKTFKVKRWCKNIFFMADKYYKEVDEDIINSVLTQDKIDAEQYVKEYFDCDDFAFSLMGTFHKNEDTAAMPIFVTWVLTPQGGHAVLSYYSGEVNIIEPQNDEIYPVPKNWKLLLLCG